MTMAGVKEVATLKILKLLLSQIVVSICIKEAGRRVNTHNDFPECLSSHTLLDLLKICSFVCSAGNM